MSAEISMVLKNLKRGKFSVTLELIDGGKVLSSKKLEDININWAFSRRMESVGIGEKNVVFSLVTHSEPTEKTKKEIATALAKKAKRPPKGASSVGDVSKKRKVARKGIKQTK